MAFVSGLSGHWGWFVEVSYDFEDLQRRLGVVKRDRLGGEPSDRDLARAVGASPNTVGAWLRGEHFPQTFEPLRTILELVRTAAEQQARLKLRVDEESEETIAELLSISAWNESYEAERQRRRQVSREATERQQARAVLLREGPVVVVPGRNITVQLPPQVNPALSGLANRAQETFVGRDHLVRELLNDLAPDPAPRPRSELVTSVAGMGGVGKTELAVHTATTARDTPGWFPGGVLFIDLFGYDIKRRLTAEQALDNLLRALGLGEHVPTNLQDRVDLYRTALVGYIEQGRRILVVLDNACTADQVTPLLPDDGFTTIVITSRHTLGIEEIRLRDLDVLDEETSCDLLRRALAGARGKADNRVTDAPGDAAAVARLCGGLPLALRMCAAQLAAAPTRPLASLVSALDEERTRLDRLGRRRGDHAVRGAFELSYHQLDNDQAQMFRLLSLNPGPDVSTETAAHLASANPYDTEELLRSLLEAHLIETRGSWGRWRLHDLVQVFAYEHAAAARAADADRDRLLEYYRDRSSQANSYVVDLRNTTPHGFTDRNQALDWLDAEHDNVLAAAVLADTTGRARVAFDLALGIETHLATNRYLNERHVMAELAIRAAHTLDDGFAAARAHVALSDAQREAGAANDAIRAARTARDLYCDLQDRPGEGTALRALASSLSAAGRHEEAVTAGRTSIDLLRLGPNEHYVGVSLMDLGLHLAAVDRHEEAVAALREALTILSRTSYSVEGFALHNLGSVLLSANRSTEAIGVLQRAVARCRQAGSRWDLSNAGLALTNLAEAWEVGERYDAAVGAWEQAVTLFKKTGQTTFAGMALAELGACLTAHERHGEALRPLNEAMELLCGPTSQPGEASLPALASTLAYAAEGLHTLGEWDKACQAYSKAIDIWRQITNRNQDDYQLYMARALVPLSQARFETGTLGAAREAIAEAVAILRRLAAAQPELHTDEFREALSVQAEIN